MKRTIAVACLLLSVATTFPAGAVEPAPDRKVSITIDDVASEIGYSDRRSFLRAFRRFTGMTPGEYRRIPRR